MGLRHYGKLSCSRCERPPRSFSDFCLWYYGGGIENEIVTQRVKHYTDWPNEYIDTDVAYPPYICQECRNAILRERERAATPVQQQTVVTQVHPQNIIVNGKQGNAGTLCNVSFSLGLGANWDDLSGGTITNNSEYSSGDILINYYLVENDDENKKHLMKQVNISLLNPNVNIPVQFGSEVLSDIPSGTYVPYVTVSELMANGMYAEIYKTYFGSGEIAARRNYTSKSSAAKPARSTAVKPIKEGNSTLAGKKSTPEHTLLLKDGGIVYKGSPSVLGFGECSFFINDPLKIHYITIRNKSDWNTADLCIKVWLSKKITYSTKKEDDIYLSTIDVSSIDPLCSSKVDLWVEIPIPDDLPGGRYYIIFTLHEHDEAKENAVSTRYQSQSCYSVPMTEEEKEAERKAEDEAIQKKIAAERIEWEKKRKEKAEAEKKAKIEAAKKSPVVDAPLPEVAKAAEFIFCYKCGTKLPADAVFCAKCGTKLK